MIANAHNFSPIPESTPFAMWLCNSSQEGESILPNLHTSWASWLTWLINCSRSGGCHDRGKESIRQIVDPGVTHDFCPYFTGKAISRPYVTLKGRSVHPTVWLEEKLEIFREQMKYKVYYDLISSCLLNIFYSFH